MSEKGEHEYNIMRHGFLVIKWIDNGLTDEEMTELEGLRTGLEKEELEEAKKKNDIR